MVLAFCLQSASTWGITLVRGVRGWPVYTQALTLLGEALAERAFRRRGLAALKEMEERCKDQPRQPDDVDSVILLREDRER